MLILLFQVPSVPNTVSTQFILRTFPFDPKRNLREFVSLTGAKFIASGKKKHAKAYYYYYYFLQNQKSFGSRCRAQGRHFSCSARDDGRVAEEAASMGSPQSHSHASRGFEGWWKNCKNCCSENETKRL